MKKYLLIAKKYNKITRGAHTTSERLVHFFADYLDYKTDKECIGILDQLNEEYRRLIFVTQSPTMYCFKANFISLKKFNYSYFIRKEFTPALYQNATSNGFNYAYFNQSIEHYVPFMFDFQVESISKKESIPVVGFYIRPGIVPDSFKYAIRFAKMVRMKIHMIILGDCNYPFESFNNIVSCKKTFDNQYFFKNITHYIYPRSAWFEDPFPNSLLEATHCNKQIVIPDIPGRKHKDGIDDIAEVINYHKIFDPDKELDNTNCPLKIQNFERFYMRLFENNFENKLDRRKYSCFQDWLDKEIFKLH